MKNTVMHESDFLGTYTYTIYQNLEEVYCFRTGLEVRRHGLLNMVAELENEGLDELAEFVRSQI